MVRRLTEAGLEPIRIDVPDAEAAKTAEVAARCWAVLGRAGFTRSDAVVGVGGGATTDLAGFVAATWLRGVALVNVPTTVLGMVDAAVGGKTGHQHRRGQEPGRQLPRAGRRALRPGRCWPACPPPTWSPAWPRWSSAGSSPTRRSWTWSSPTRRRRVDPGSDRAARAGRAGHPGQGARWWRPTCGRRPRPGPRVGRELLNYGHTLGHAIERREQYRWRHGEAVSVGLVYAAELARLAGRLDDVTADRHRDGARPARAAHGVRGGRLRRPARHHGGGQEDPRLDAAVRDPERAGQRGDPQRAAGRAAAQRLRGGGAVSAAEDHFAEAATAYADLVAAIRAGPVGGAGAGGVGPAGSGRAHQPVPDHRRDLPGAAGRRPRT